MEWKASAKGMILVGEFPLKSTTEASGGQITLEAGTSVTIVDTEFRLE